MYKHILEVPLEAGIPQWALGQWVGKGGEPHYLIDNLTTVLIQYTNDGEVLGQCLMPWVAQAVEYVGEGKWSYTDTGYRVKTARGGRTYRGVYWVVLTPEETARCLKCALQSRPSTPKDLEEAWEELEGTREELLHIKRVNKLLSERIAFLTQRQEELV